MKGLIALLVAIVILGGGYYWYTSQQAPTDGDAMMDAMNGMDMMPSESPSTSTAGSASATGTQNGDVKEFTVTAKNFSFDPAAMTVKKGDRVRITFVNAGGMHDFVLDEFGAHTKILQDGAQETIEFVADEAGSFEYYCSVGQHREMGMKGTLTVTE